MIEEELKQIDKDIVAKSKNFCSKYSYLNFEWEDIAQDLRLLVIEKDQLYKKDAGDYKPFMFTCMNNYLKDRLKAEMRQKRYPKSSSERGLENIIDINSNGMASNFSDDFRDNWV